jgi:hypothetical protein
MARTKFKQGDRFKGRAEGRGGAAYRNRTGTILEFYGPGQYKVTFDDSPGVVEFVYSYWIEPLLR